MVEAQPSPALWVNAFLPQLRMVPRHVADPYETELKMSGELTTWRVSASNQSNTRMGIRQKTFS